MNNKAFIKGLYNQALFEYKPDNKDADEVFLPFNSLSKALSLSLDVLEDAMRGEGYEEQFSEGFELEGQGFDVNVYDGEISGSPSVWICELIDAQEQDGYWERGYNSQFLYRVKKETVRQFFAQEEGASS